MTQIPSSWRSARAERPLGVILRLAAAGLLAMLRVLVRRPFRGPKRAAWSWGLELTAEAQRATWALMPRVGVVRWRNAVEALLVVPPRGVTLRSVDAGGVASEWFEPPEPKEPVVLYLHGGGYVFGSPATHAALLAELATSTGFRALVPDYRLAPEHPKPAALEDALRAYRFLLASGVSPGHIVIAGDSAGGNLALVTLLALREAGEPLPAAAVLICPWVDLGCSGASMDSNAPYDFITKEVGLLAAGHYLAGADASDPSASPLYADLAGLPPLLIQAGGAETLRDQVVAFAERARDASVETQLHVYDDMVHVWHLLLGFLPEARRAIDEIASFARKAVS